MNARARFIAGGVAVLGTAGYLMVTAIRETGMRWLTPSELHAKAASDPTVMRTGVKVGARVVPGSIERHANGRDITFLATDGDRELKVRVSKTPPDTFSDSADVIVTGKMLADGSFEASDLVAKCASRFEVAPDSNDPKYRQTPGYKAATKGGR